MKTKQSLLMPAIILLVCLSMQANAKTWRINNVPGIIGDFTTPQLAHDHASVQAGDTLYIEPSTINLHYGPLNMTKRLTIISVGDFLADNPGVQFSSIPSNLLDVEVNAGASGSVFHCNMNKVVLNGGADNCRFERCRFTNINGFGGSLWIRGANNITVLQNYFVGNLIIDNTTFNNVISNNIVQGALSMSADAAALISNNILNAAFSSGNNFIQNATFQNNIINKDGVYTFTNCTVKNNLAGNTTLPAGNGNVNNVNMTNVFVNASGTNDVSFVLKAGSPAIGAGESGADCGAYGGTSPFKPGLQAAIPAIYQLVVPTTPGGNTMNITFSTRSNN